MQINFESPEELAERIAAAETEYEAGGYAKTGHPAEHLGGRLHFIAEVLAYGECMCKSFGR